MVCLTCTNHKYRSQMLCKHETFGIIPLGQYLERPLLLLVRKDDRRILARSGSPVTFLKWWSCLHFSIQSVTVCMPVQISWSPKLGTENITSSNLLRLVDIFSWKKCENNAKTWCNKKSKKWRTPLFHQSTKRCQTKRTDLFSYPFIV